MTFPEESQSFLAEKQHASSDTFSQAHLLSHLSSEQLDELAEALTPRISAILARQVNQRRYGA